MRQFIRHPVDIPIEVSMRDLTVRTTPQIRNVSLGGLAFRFHQALPPETLVEVRIPFVHPMFASPARVVWCHPHGGEFELGVAFLETEDAFRARMVEQVCHIEDYRKRVLLTEARALSVEEAAAEWIVKYAAQFPDPGADEVQ